MTLPICLTGSLGSKHVAEQTDDPRARMSWQSCAAAARQSCAEYVPPIPRRAGLVTCPQSASTLLGTGFWNNARLTKQN